MKRAVSGLALVVLVVVALSGTAFAAEPLWKASWITHPTAPLREPIVLHFRRSLPLDSKPERFVVHVSADNRFILYVNGHRVGDGPARGDLPHWRYETFDLAPYLSAGANLVTATVWNFGIYAPAAQITDRTAFLLQGDGALEAALSTPTGWMVAVEPGRVAVPRTPGGVDGYMANGPGEELNAAAYDWQWNQAADPSRAWVAAASPMRENIYPSQPAPGWRESRSTTTGGWCPMSYRIWRTPPRRRAQWCARRARRQRVPRQAGDHCGQSPRAFASGSQDVNYRLSSTDGFRGKGRQHPLDLRGGAL